MMINTRCKWLSSLVAVMFGLMMLAGCSSHEVVVVGGGDNSENILNTADIYNVSSGTFSKSARVMSTGRLTATATTLTDGTVLIAGGQSSTTLNTAEIYQPISDSFTLTTGVMNRPRVAHAATLLDPAVVSGPLAGNVLITGGDAFSTVGTAETYNPLSGSFSKTGSMAIPRRQHTSVLISHCGCAADGLVLVVGGYDNQFTVLSSAELYNPATGTFTATGNLKTPRFRHTATLLNNGTVLITGGASQMAAKTGDINPSLNTAEIYDPKTGTFTLTKGTMSAYREAHAASMLQDGTVLLTGGQDDHFLVENTAELYSPATGTFSPTSASCAGAPPPPGCMSTGRDFHISLTLDDGRVLIVGGVNSAFTTVASAEIYNPASKTFTPTGNLSSARSGAAASLIISGR